ncbi:MAG: hypothetical protein R3253_05320 [Longimicrobiales bacterium]|nr:hypothetical protein [Longimicrobiales bacterium]
MRISTRRRMAAVALLALAGSACDTGTAPDLEPDFDAQAALADYQTMQAAMASDDLSPFQALEGRTPFASTPAAIDVMASVSQSGHEVGSRAFALAAARRLLAASTEATRSGLGEPAQGPIISGWHRGTTFVYDPGSDQYQPDLEMEGAPATGVRFILYEVDDTGTPIREMEIGYADLVDEGDGSVEDIVLRLTVVLEDETRLDYRITLDHDATSGALTVDGFFVGDDTRLDFDIALGLSQIDGVGQAELDFHFGVESRGFSVAGHVSGIEENDDGAGSFELEVRHGGHTVAVEATGADGVIDGTIFVDGEAFATVTGPAGDPVIADPDGEALTVSELQLLHRVVHGVEHAFRFLERLLDPVDEIVLLGFIL